MVYGRRVKREMPVIWSLLYKLFYRILAAVSYLQIPKDAGDFSLMDKRVVGWLLRCPERDLFMRGLRAYVGFRQTGVDYIRPERMFGRSTNSLWKNIEWAKQGIFSFSNAPLKVLTAAGSVLLLTATLLAAVAAGDPDLLSRQRTAWRDDRAALCPLLRLAEPLRRGNRRRVHCEDHGRGEGAAASDPGGPDQGR